LTRGYLGDADGPAFGRLLIAGAFGFAESGAVLAFIAMEAR
jgi:hypothetical protein